MGATLFGLMAWSRAMVGSLGNPNEAQDGFRGDEAFGRRIR
jgi:hypothetical protein